MTKTFLTQRAAPPATPHANRITAHLHRCRGSAIAFAVLVAVSVVTLVTLGLMGIQGMTDRTATQTQLTLAQTVMDSTINTIIYDLDQTLRISEDKLEAFASFYGADYYGLPRNTETINLRREEWQVPASVGFGEHQLVPLRAGEMLKWKLVG